MNTERRALSSIIAATMGLTGLLLAQPAAAIIENGNYKLKILNTPYTTGPQFGTNGNWNSSFTFGCLPGTKGCVSQYMYDNGTTHNSRGSGIAGDGVAGVLNITVTNNTVSVTSLNVDAIFNTAGGTFVQYANNTSAMTGTISGTQLTLIPTNRLGSITAPQMLDRNWLVDDCQSATCSSSNGNTAWNSLTTTSATNSNGTLNGTPLVNAGDLNGDGRDDYRATLVGGGWIGSSWDSFFGATYFEVWKTEILSRLQADDDTAIALAGSGAITINLVANDTTPESGGLNTAGITLNTAASTECSTGTAGMVTNNSNGTVSYTPPASTYGTDCFTYTISDGVDTDTALVTISDSKTLADTGTTNQNTAVVIDVVANDDVTIDPTTVSVTTAPNNGSTMVNSTTGAITYTPAADFVGTDTLTYTAQDSGASNFSATVTVTVRAVLQATAGTVTPAAGTTNGRMSTSQINALPADSTVDRRCVGGCFSYSVSGLTNGQQIGVVLLPLSEPIPSEGTVSFRKVINNVWVDYSTAGGDSVSSAAGSSTSCPSNASLYTPGLTGGHNCIRLVITDGGANDADGTANGTIVDPVGVSVDDPDITNVVNNRGSFDTSGGCTLRTTASDAGMTTWAILGGLLALLAGVRRKIQP